MSDLKVKLFLSLVDGLTSPIRKLGSSFVRTMKDMNASVRKLGVSVQEFGKSMRNVGGDLTMGISAPVAALGTVAVTTAARWEKMGASLKTVTGSQQAANAAMAELLEFATKTPFELEEVIGSFIKLKSRGLDPSTKSLTNLGNISSAMGKSLDQMIEAVADAVTGEFERLKEFGIIAHQQGKYVTFTFNGVKTKVRKDAGEIQKYLESIGEINFGTAMADQMLTLSGGFSNLQDSVSGSMNIIGLSIARNLNIKQHMLDLADAVQSLTEKFTLLPEPVQKFIVYGGLLLAILGPILLGIGQIVIGIGGLVYAMTFLGPAFAVFFGVFTNFIIAMRAGYTVFQAFNLLLISNPIGMVVLAIGALAGAAYLVISNWQKVKEFFADLWTFMKDIFSKIGNVTSLLNPFGGIAKIVSGGINLAMGNSAVAGSAPMPVAAAQKGQKVDTGGTLNIKIDSSGVASVQNAQSNDPRMGYSVDSGPIMAGAN